MRRLRYRQLSTSHLFFYGGTMRQQFATDLSKGKDALRVSMKTEKLFTTKVKVSKFLTIATFSKRPMSDYEAFYLQLGVQASVCL